MVSLSLWWKFVGTSNSIKLSFVNLSTFWSSRTIFIHACSLRLGAHSHILCSLFVRSCCESVPPNTYIQPWGVTAEAWNEISYRNACGYFLQIFSCKSNIHISPRNSSESFRPATMHMVRSWTTQEWARRSCGCWTTCCPSSTTTVHVEGQVCWIHLSCS